MSSTHYVATVKIERVDHISTEKRTSGPLINTNEQTTRRVVTPLTSFIIRNDELSDLVTTIGHHLVHVNDITAIDPDKGTTRG